jgi:ADP-dependent NAD(P)H-hydrate dehydratase / NAD(P)H-hydrate epimerase
MENTYWHKQTATEPLFPDLQWSKPENRRAAGKLLIVGGHAHGFAIPAQAYQESIKAGIGVAKVLLPDALQKLVGTHMEAAEFAPSTPSGSFGRKSLLDLMERADWADGTLIAGELGRNSETAIVLESFVEKYEGRLTLTRDSVDYYYHIAEKLLRRPATLLVVSMAQLQKLCMAARFPRAVTFSMDLLHLIDALHELTSRYPVTIMVKHLSVVLVAHDGQVSTTRLDSEIPIWRVQHAAHAATWWLQHSSQPFEAITTSVIKD